MKTCWRKESKKANIIREILNPPRVVPDALTPRELARYRYTRAGNSALLAGLHGKAAAISRDIIKAAAARGRDISHLAAELADDAAGGMGLKIAELGISQDVLLAMLARENIPAPVNAAGYRTAQNLLRRMAHTSTEQLAGWHETMAYEDAPEKDTLDAAYDHAAAVIARARALLAAAREHCAASGPPTSAPTGGGFCAGCIICCLSSPMAAQPLRRAAIKACTAIMPPPPRVAAWTLRPRWHTDRQHPPSKIPGLAPGIFFAAILT